MASENVTKTVSLKDYIIDMGDVAVKGIAQYEVVLENNTDFIIKRRTATTDRELVILVSKGLYYIKDCKTGHIEELKEQSLNSFLRDLKDGMIVLHQVHWLSNLYRESVGLIMQVINDECLTDMCRHNVLVKSFDPSWYTRYWKQNSKLFTQFPYMVFERDLIDFETADQLAQANGIPKNAPERLDAGLLYTLKLAEHDGHLCMHKEAFVRRAVNLLHAPLVTWKGVAQRAFEMIQAERLTLYNDYVYRPIMAKAEEEVATRIRDMLNRDKLPYMGDLDDEIDTQQSEMGFAFAEEQRHAIQTALTSPISIISGGPGTGKTSIQRAILNIYKKAFPDSDVVCCAPTGRAARRMEQSTGFPASTIHKALNLTGGELHELKDLQLLEADLVLVDEVSMMDMMTTWCLFNALPPGCRLILVGDADQLPSVGPGAVLNELLACGRLPAVILDKVFRQSEGSLIAENAQRIRHGESDLQFGDDFQFWASADEAQSAQYLKRLYKSAVARFGVDNVALLTPFRKKSETGVHSLNAALHDAINPKAPGKAEIEIGQRILRVGDKVMQMKNRDFASNGDIGYICTSMREPDGLLVEVDFGDDRVVAYEDVETLRQLELAYATTIHKSQGSEYDAVLINIQNMHGKMLNRALFYTAETRAKKLVIIVGDWDAVVRAIQTADTKCRHTMLALRINELTKE